MGNCIIVKLLFYILYIIFKFVELVLVVFFSGVFQVFNGNNEVGRFMIIYFGIDKIIFIGLIVIGRKVYENVIKIMKKVILEFGGNDVSIVCFDVDVQYVVKQVVIGVFFYGGQMCVVIKWIYVY